MWLRPCLPPPEGNEANGLSHIVAILDLNYVEIHSHLQFKSGQETIIQRMKAGLKVVLVLVIFYLLQDGQIGQQNGIVLMLILIKVILKAFLK